ncbi:MAG TPA: FGGY-family carbohydrate kinase [Candidatus Methylacidiphilales bacterium]
MKPSPLYLGIDVGTGSARAGLFTASGKRVGTASHPIRMWKPKPDFVEQSSADIWRACCRAVAGALKESGAPVASIAGIGFDATCSLVALDGGDRPVTVSPGGRDEQNVIVWMDHRAVAQAERINATRHPVLRYVGGSISPEMEMPKLLWLKERLPASWKRAARFLDLPDYLTYRATGDDARSLCSTVCKWNYLGQRGEAGEGWDREYLKAIGLADLAADGFGKIGRRVLPMGAPLGKGLTPKAARELGLRPGIPVSVSIIDAHAGGLGLLGAPTGGRPIDAAAMGRRLALIGGTSSCHMAVSPKPRYVEGVWGPYFSAMVPGLWLTEGGQSATGALIDHIISSHVASGALRDEAAKTGKTVYQLLNERLERLRRKEGRRHSAELTRDFHLQPDFHGNRSPLADPARKGAMVGLALSATLDDLAVQYLAAIQAVAYGTRHILEEMRRKGIAIETLFLCGGGTKNPLFVREHADATGCRVVLPKEPEAVLLGSALLGAVAAGAHPGVLAAMGAMNREGKTIEPRRGAVADYHAKKYRIHRRMQDDFAAYREIMAATES